MNRSNWKGPYIAEKSIKSLKKFEKSYTNSLVSRGTQIVPQFVNKTFNIYTGNKFSSILVTEEMIGHKFGEFSNTRKQFIFKKKKK